MFFSSSVENSQHLLGFTCLSFILFSFCTFLLSDPTFLKNHDFNISRKGNFKVNLTNIEIKELTSFNSDVADEKKQTEIPTKQQTVQPTLKPTPQPTLFPTFSPSTAEHEFDPPVLESSGNFVKLNPKEDINILSLNISDLPPNLLKKPFHLNAENSKKRNWENGCTSIPSLAKTQCYGYFPKTFSEPKLLILQPVDTRWFEKQKKVKAMDAVGKGWKCYAEKWGYGYAIFSYELMENYTVHSTKWITVLDMNEIWEDFDWILVIDFDSLVINQENSFEKYIKYDGLVHWSVRLNIEVIAGSVLFRTTEYFWKFLHHWAHLRGVGWNSDNGNLLEILMGIYQPEDLDDLKEAHEEATDRDHGKFLQVFTRLHKTMKDPKLTYPFRFWYPREGYWQELNLDRNQREKEVKRAVWKHTITGHGCKKCYRHVLGDECSTLNENVWILTEEEEIKYAKKWCLWRDPICFKNGTNLCYQESCGEYPMLSGNLVNMGWQEWPPKGK